MILIFIKGIPLSSSRCRPANAVDRPAPTMSADVASKLSTSINVWVDNLNLSNGQQDGGVYFSGSRKYNLFVFSIFCAFATVMTFSLQIGNNLPDESIYPAGSVPFGPAGADFSFMNALDARGFLRYVAVVMWIAVVSTGLGLELVLGEFMIQRVDAKLASVFWHASQLFFALFLTIAIFSASAYGLPFAVLGESSGSNLSMPLPVAAPSLKSRHDVVWASACPLALWSL